MHVSPAQALAWPWSLVQTVLHCLQGMTAGCSQHEQWEHQVTALEPKE